MRQLARSFFFSISKWKLKGGISPEIFKCVIIVAPHTSWYDFFLGLLVRQILVLRIKFVAKKELFRQPFGWYFKRVGGIALDRTANQNMVEAIAEVLRSGEIFRLALSTEGTRKKTDRWKTGFYYIARAANAPVIMVAFDYDKKEVRISEPFYTSGNMKEDLKRILQYYDGVTGRIPEYF